MLAAPGGRDKHFIEGLKDGLPASGRAGLSLLVKGAASQSAASFALPAAIATIAAIAAIIALPTSAILSAFAPFAAFIPLQSFATPTAVAVAAVVTTIVTTVVARFGTWLAGAGRGVAAFRSVRSGMLWSWHCGGSSA